MNPTQQRDIGQQVFERMRYSGEWMAHNFHPQWERVFKNYLCEADIEVDANNPAFGDATQTYLGMPDTWGWIRRTVARCTAQPPNLRFVCKDRSAAELIGRTLMWQWDAANIQSYQKLHVLQGALMGWSVRPWYWCIDEHPSMRRVNLLGPDLKEEHVQAVFEQYQPQIEQIAQRPIDQIMPEEIPAIAAQLTAMVGRRGMVPVQKVIRSYDGPKCDFLFVGDCFPQPNFRRIQSSQWFIVRRRRDIEWISRTVKAYPELVEGFQELLTKFPKGTPRDNDQDSASILTPLRRKLEKVAGYKTNYTNNEDPGNLHEWEIVEQHTPGNDPKITYVMRDGTLIGEIPYPYYLEGKIAFTELTLIDSLLSGIGDSTARVLRGIQRLHNRMVSTRSDVFDRLLRPYIFTSDRTLFDNADQSLRRLGGYRLILTRYGANALQFENQGPALAAAGASLNDETALMRIIQTGTGDSNMSMAANVDPGQMRTATGARLVAYNQDVLTKDTIDAVTYSSLKPDAEMMFMLNRSEMPDDGSQEFYAPQYNRNFSAQGDTLRDQWVQVSGTLFQMDGMIVAEVGSTLADDDEAKVQKATNLFQASVANPQLFNQEKARDEFLVAHGKGRELDQWIPQPPPPPGPEPPRISVSFQGALMPPDVQAQLLGVPPDVMAAPVPGPEGPVPPGGGGSSPPSTPPPEEPLVGASALAAAQGNSPLGETGQPAA